jgi:hypothetical protein
MFVRFRQSSSRRLDLSLVEARRSNGKVKQEHVASLGSIFLPPSVADRIAFWARLHERLARLSNRIGGDMHGKILGSVHARIPMPTAEEQRALQLENAKADAKFWGSLEDLHAGNIESHKVLVAGANQRIAEAEAEKTKVAAKAATEKERIANLERGEDVQVGFGKPMTYKDSERILGKAALKRFRQVAELPEHAMSEVTQEYRRRAERADKAALKVVRRRYGLR